MKKILFKTLFCLMTFFLAGSIFADVTITVEDIKQNDVSLEKVDGVYQVEDISKLSANFKIDGLDAKTNYYYEYNRRGGTSSSTVTTGSRLANINESDNFYIYPSADSNISELTINVKSIDEENNLGDTLASLTLKFNIKFYDEYKENQQGRIKLEEIKQSGNTITPIVNSSPKEYVFTINNQENVNISVRGYNLMDDTLYEFYDGYYKGSDLEAGKTFIVPASEASYFSSGAKISYPVFSMSSYLKYDGDTGYSWIDFEYVDLDSTAMTFKNKIKYKNFSKEIIDEYNLFEEEEEEQEYVTLLQEYYNKDNPLLFELDGNNYENKNYNVNILIKKKYEKVFEKNYTVSGEKLNEGTFIEFSEFIPKLNSVNEDSNPIEYNEYDIYLTIGNITKLITISYEYAGNIYSEVMYGNNKFLHFADDYDILGIYVKSYSLNEKLYNDNNKLFKILYEGYNFVDSINYTYKAYYSSKNSLNDQELIESGTISGKELNNYGLLINHNNDKNYTNPCYIVKLYKDSILIKKDALIIENEKYMPYIDNLKFNNLEDAVFNSDINTYTFSDDSTPSKISFKGIGFDETKEYNVYISRYESGKGMSDFDHEEISITKSGAELNNDITLDLPAVNTENSIHGGVEINISSEDDESDLITDYIYYEITDDLSKIEEPEISIEDSEINFIGNNLTYQLNIKSNYNDHFVFTSDNDKVTIGNFGKITVSDNTVKSATITMKGIIYNSTATKTITFKYTNNTEILTTPVVAVENTAYNKNVISYNKVDGAAGYKIYYATSSTGKYVLLKTTTALSYTHNYLKTGTTYYYKVKSYKVVNKKNVYSSYSTAVSAKATLRPTVLTGVSNNYRYSKITWTSVSGASGYRVYRNSEETGAYTYIGTTTTTNYYDKTAVEGKTYYYKVKAYRTISGSKKYSVYSNAVASNRLSDAINYTVTNTGYLTNTITINENPNATEYYIYRATSKYGTYKLVKTILSSSAVEGKLIYVNSGLSYNRSYYYKVKMKYVNTSDYSSTKTAKTVYVNKATIKEVQNNYRYAEITWTSVSGASGYRVYRSTTETGAYTYIGATTTTNYYDKTAVEGKTYYYKIKVYKTSLGKYYYSAYSNVVASNRMVDTITFSAVSNGYNSTKITINEDPNATEYYIYIATSKSGTYKLIKTLLSSEAEDGKITFVNTGLTFNKTYYYKIKMKYINTSDYTSYKSVKTALSTPIITAEGIQLTENRVIIEKVDGATGYQIYRSFDGGKYEKIKTLNTLTYDDLGLPLGTELKYTYKVRAYKKIGTKVYYSIFSEGASLPPANEE